MFKSWWSAKRSKQKMLTKTQKNKKGPLSHRKIKCSFLDNIQLLMIDQAIWAKNVDQNTKKREIEIGLNMNTIGKKSFQERSSSTFYQSTPPFHYHYLILCLNRKLVNFNFKWVYGLKLFPPSFSQPKWLRMLIFGIRSISPDSQLWSNGLEPHPPPHSSQWLGMAQFRPIHNFSNLLLTGQAGSDMTWTSSANFTWCCNFSNLCSHFKWSAQNDLEWPISSTDLQLFHVKGPSKFIPIHQIIIFADYVSTGWWLAKPDLGAKNGWASSTEKCTSVKGKNIPPKSSKNKPLGHILALWFYFW